MTKQRSAIASQAGSVASVRGRRGILGRVYAPRTLDSRNREALAPIQGRPEVRRRLAEIVRREDDESYP